MDDTSVKILLSKFGDIHDELQEIKKDGKDRSERIVKLEATLNNGLKSTVQRIEQKINEIDETLIRVEAAQKATDQKMTEHIDDEMSKMVQAVFTPPPEQPIPQWVKVVFDNWLKLAVMIGIIIGVVIIIVTTGSIPAFLTGMIGA